MFRPIHWVALTKISGDRRGVSFNPVFTPNGDGVNDALEVEYTVIQISEPKPIRVVIYDSQDERFGL